MRRVKAWAVLDACGDLGRFGDDCGLYYITTVMDSAVTGCEREWGERVVPVVIEIQEEK